MAQKQAGAPHEAEVRREDMFVVGIGASAGGLEALQQFFRFMPPKSGLGFVVIQHLAPDYKSLMADILGKYTQMAVHAGRGRHGRGGKHRLSHPPEKEHHLPQRQAVFARLCAGHAQPPHRHLPQFAGGGEKGALHRRCALRHRLGRHRRRQVRQGKGRADHRAGAGHRQV